jgi:DNA-binding NarL/FixJ family response regulator
MYDKVKLFNFPVKDHLLVISTEPGVKVDELSEKVFKYIASVENELSLYPPGNIVNPEKKEVVWNLHHSGISEELIAEQLDLDVNTVKMLIAEIR